MLQRSGQVRRGGLVARSSGQRQAAPARVTRRGLLGLFGGAALGGFGAVEPVSASAQGIVNAARDLLGKKYRRGGNGPTYYDCSGFTWKAVLQGANETISQDLRRQSKSAGREVPLKSKQLGDLIFFRINGKLGHVGIYLGGGELISAMNPRDDIRIMPISRLGGRAYKARRVE